MNYLGRKLSPPKKPRRPIRKLGRLGKLRAKGKRDAGKLYESQFGKVCQSCGRVSDLDRHHKTKASAGGTEDSKNLLCLCRSCHNFIHQSGFEKRERFVLADPANVENGQRIDWKKFDERIQLSLP